MSFHGQTLKYPLNNKSQATLISVVVKFAKKRIMLYFYNFFEGRPRVGRRGRGKLLYRFDR